MRKTLLGLFLLAAVGFGAWRFFAPPAASKNPMERMKTASPIETVRVAKPVAPAPVVRSAPAASSQMTPQRAKMEERFSDLKEEGRRVRETLLASDPKAAQAYNEVVRRPEYRTLIDRRHQIEAAWAAAPEKDRDGMLNEMNSLRQQGFALILSEIQRIQSQPAATTASGASAATSAPSSAPAPAPVAPVVFQ
jgi:hypothetical protein